MKKQLLKGVLVFSLAGALTFSGVALPNTGLTTVEAAKLTTNTTLDTVTGIAYDAATKKLSWNKVAGATKYKIVLKDATGGQVSSTTTSSLSWTVSGSYGYYDEDDNWHSGSLPDGTYTVTIKALDDTSVYLAAAGITYADIQTATTGLSYYTDYYYEQVGENASGDTTYNLYKYPASAEATATVTLTTPQVTTTAVTTMSALKVKETGETSVTFQPVSKVSLAVDEEIQWEYSNNDKFVNNSNKKLFARTGSDIAYDQKVQEMVVSYDSYEPGSTLYVRARVYNPHIVATAADAVRAIGAYSDTYPTWSAYREALEAAEKADEAARYSAYSPVLTYTVPTAKIAKVLVKATTSEVTLDVSTTNGYVTGYQFDKKFGSKWITVATQTDGVYKDQGLTKETAYQYRVRAYVYNKTTGKTTWTKYAYTNATTWGSNLNFKAAAASATSVKLTWKPVTGAEGYEIYRVDTDSYTENVSAGVGEEYFTTSTLIKTIKKQKTKSYTDKKLMNLADYTYLIRAYKTIGKQKIYLDAEASISLRPGSLGSYTSYLTAAGKTMVSWNKKTGLKGYYVEKYDETAGDWVSVKTLKASATSNTFDKVNPGEDRVQYRIRPYDADVVYDGTEITVYPTIAAPANVKAAKTATGVQVTWSAVPGADYYVVYRTTDNSYVYNKTTKTYSYSGGVPVYEGAVNTEGCFPELGKGDYKTVGTYWNDEIRGTSVVDQALVYKTRAKDDNGEYIVTGSTPTGDKIYQTEETFYNGYEGPEAGTTYYYYVRAYVKDANGVINTWGGSSAVTKAAAITYTNKVATKVSKITSAKSKKKGQVTVSFKKVSGVTGYAIYRSTKKNGTYTLVGTTTKTSFTDTTATSGKTAYYKVASYVEGEAKANIYSAKTAAKSVKVK